MSSWLTFTNALAFAAFLAVVDLFLLVRYLRRRRKLKAEQEETGDRRRSRFQHFEDDSLAVSAEEEREEHLPTATEARIEPDYVPPIENRSERWSQEPARYSEPATFDPEPATFNAEPVDFYATPATFDPHPPASGSEFASGAEFASGSEFESGSEFAPGSEFEGYAPELPSTDYEPEELTRGQFADTPELNAYASEPVEDNAAAQDFTAIPAPIVVDEKVELKLWKGLKESPKPSKAAEKRIYKTPVIPIEENTRAHAKLQKTALNLRTFAGVNGAAFISTSCQLLASSPAVTVGSEHSFPTAVSMFALGKRISDELGRDALDHVMVRGDKGYVLFERVLEDVLLIVVIQEDAPMGPVVNEARRAADLAADALLD